MELIIPFKQEKETKNTVRYTEIHDEDDNFVVGTVYVQKSALQGKAPERITLTLRDES
jgi:hypothetical protein